MAAPTDRRPPPPKEDRRLKLLGMALVAAAGLAIGMLSERAAGQWPLSAERLVPFALALLVAVNVAALGLLVLAAGCGSTGSLRKPARRRAIALQLLLANVMAPGLLYGLLEGSFNVESEIGQAWDFGVAIAGSALFLLSWRLWRRSRQHDAPSADEAMALDPRPPVLYLRSFRDDDETQVDDAGSALMRRYMQLLRPPSPEQEMADVLGRVGPVVAIGKPGEPLPQLGAARLYVDHDQWQGRVMALMAKARLVVVRVGASPGVLWEIEQALAHLPRQRLVFAILGGAAVAPELVARLAPVLGPTFEAALPQPRGPGWKTLWIRDPRRRIGGLVCFGPDGSAHAAPVRLWPIAWGDVFLFALMRQSAPPLRYAWRRVFQRLGIPWLDDARRRSRALAVVLALVFGWFGAHWFYLGNKRRGALHALFFWLMVPLLLAFIDAVRFVWAERAEFEARFVTLRDGGGAANIGAHGALTR